jgi:hypothetical protein
MTSLVCVILALALGAYDAWAYAVGALKAESVFGLGVGVASILGFGIVLMVLSTVSKGGGLGPIWKPVPHNVSVSDAIRNRRIQQNNHRRSARHI